MSEQLPEAVWSGKMNVFGIEVQCYRLADGRNIIEAGDFNRLVDALFHAELAAIEAAIQQIPQGDKHGEG